MPDLTLQPRLQLHALPALPSMASMASMAFAPSPRWVPGLAPAKAQRWPAGQSAGLPARLFASLALLLTAGLPPAALAQACQATAGAVPPVVVELYTSEGCSSCPPADRWLSSLKGRSDVLPLAFHVTYWDSLGWPDAFAKPEFTQRQYDWSRVHRSAQVYTPQAIVDGRDWRVWPRLPDAAAAERPRAPVSLRLQRQGDTVVADIGAAPAATPALAGYWVVTENGHLTPVKAGENAGRTLAHDHVVRLLQPVPGWAAASGLQSRLAVTRGEAANPRRVAFVVVEAQSRRPVQALALDC